MLGLLWEDPWVGYIWGGLVSRLLSKLALVNVYLLAVMNTYTYLTRSLALHLLSKLVSALMINLLSVKFNSRAGLLIGTACSHILMKIRHALIGLVF